MKLSLAGNVMSDVAIPLLWGKKAVIEHPDGGISVIDLSTSKPRLEISKGKPAAQVQYRPIDGGYEIQDSNPMYSYFIFERKLVSKLGSLPTCTFHPTGLQIGGSFFQGNTVIGAGIGILVTEDGAISIGAPMPANLISLITR